MHNLKEIRKDFESFKDKLQNRNINIDIKNLNRLDKINRELIQTKENFEKEKKIISKSKDESLFKKSKKISNELDKVSIEYEGKIQTLEHNARDEIAQLHEIINKLRKTLEAGGKLSRNPKAKEKGK